MKKQKKIPITESKFLCDNHDIKAQKNCPFYSKGEDFLEGLCEHNDNWDADACCQCDEAIEAYISKGFQG